MLFNHLHAYKGAIVSPFLVFEGTNPMHVWEGTSTINFLPTHVQDLKEYGELKIPLIIDVKSSNFNDPVI